MNTALTSWRKGCASALLLCACGLSGATIKTATDFELVLTVLDQTNAKMSYTLDLGIGANDFWVNAQQDSGASLFRTIDPASDAAFGAFLAQANLSTTRWMVTGVYSAPLPELAVIYATQTNNGLLADQRKYFDKFHGNDSSDLFGNMGSLFNYATALNTAVTGGAIVQSTHNTPGNGSALASKNAGNTSTYASKATGFSADGGGGSNDGDCLISGAYCVGNPLGVSSWFYKITPALVEGSVDSAPVVIDEFDNLSADGYWGLIKDPSSNKYILSYTLTGSNPKSLVSTDAGLNRLSFTDYSAQSGVARLISTAADDVALQIGNSISAVPELDSWALMSLGLLGVGAAARRASRPRCSI
ncbi:hypothetical protein [Roseateles sp. P5_D6]